MAKDFDTHAESPHQSTCKTLELQPLWRHSSTTPRDRRWMTQRRVILRLRTVRMEIKIRAINHIIIGKQECFSFHTAISSLSLPPRIYENLLPPSDVKGFPPARLSPHHPIIFLLFSPRGGEDWKVLFSFSGYAALTIERKLFTPRNLFAAAAVLFSVGRLIVLVTQWSLL